MLSAMKDSIPPLLLLLSLVLFPLLAAYGQGKLVAKPYVASYDGIGEFVLPAGLLVVEGEALDSMVGPEGRGKGERLLLAYDAASSHTQDTLSFISLVSADFPRLLFYPLKWALARMSPEELLAFNSSIRARILDSPLLADSLQEGTLERLTVGIKEGHILLSMEGREEATENPCRLRVTVEARPGTLAILSSQYLLADSARWHRPFSRAHSSFKMLE